MNEKWKIRNIPKGLTFVYENLCPVCKGWMTDREVEKGYCERTGRKFSKNHREVRIFERFFGHPLKPLQKMWTIRVLRGESFAITSPTGTGKSTFGIRISEYLANKGKKCYLIVPTTNLVKQTWSRIISHIKNLRLEERDVLTYHRDMLEKEKKEILQQVKKGSFKILITTASFLVFHYTELKNNLFDFVFIDDLDAVLKGSKNLPKILRLIGYSGETTFKSSNFKKIKTGQLVIATATAKPGEATRILRKTLGIDVSSTKHHLRNIKDYKLPVEWKDREEIPRNVLNKLKDLIQEWKEGILIFLPKEGWINTVISWLKENGIRAGSDEEIMKFAEGKLDVLVGVSAPYGRLVRGIDLPERVKIAIFCGIPHRKIYIDNITPDSWITNILVNNLTKVKEKLDIPINVNIREKLSEKEMIIFQREIKKYDGKIIGTLLLSKENIIIPDIKTYIQASGRTSRLTPQGMTPGISIIIDDPKMLEVFEIKASVHDVEFDSYNYDKAMEWLTHSKGEKCEPQPVLVIVESPTKAKHISRFFGRPALRIINDQPFYEIYAGKYVLIITASLGHTVDLITKRYFHGVEVYPKIKAILPHYTTIKRCKSLGIQFTDEDIDCKDVSDSQRIINNLRYVAEEVEHVFIATDPDVEGEKIGWDLSRLLPMAKISRIELHEITKPAFKKAIESPRTIDKQLVNAQVVRRVEDRWIGFELSNKVRKAFGSNNLSAGRVQTPVLGWIIDYHKRSKKIIEKIVVDIEGTKIEIFETKRKTIKPGKVRIDVKKIKEDQEEKNPFPPYTTDELLRDAHKQLGLSSQETMSILQKLFENGLITYHRTDSIHVSDQGLRIARMFLGEEFQGRHWSSSGAHECIRPTRPLTLDDVKSFLLDKTMSLEETDKVLLNHMLKVYDLIFRRFMASQSKPIVVEYTIYNLIIHTTPPIEKQIKVLTGVYGKAFELYPYPYKINKIDSGVHLGKILIEKIPEAYPLTEGDVIKLMRERGLGRPSTYAQILNKLYKRHYIVERNGRLHPTKLGEEVYNYLTEHFKEYVSEEKTREMYQLMDEVEKGKHNAVDVLISIYEEILREVHKKA